MTQPPPPIPLSSSRNRNIGIVLLVIGLVVGLALGVLVSVAINLPSSFHTGVGVNNQVQVSGTVQYTDVTSIQFSGVNSTIKSSAPVTNDEYSILLVGGQSYSVYLYSQSYLTHILSLYVPSGATTFTANF